MSVLLPTLTVVLCKCLICVINKVNESRSAGTYIKENCAIPFSFISEMLLQLANQTITRPIIFCLPSYCLF